MKLLPLVAATLSCSVAPAQPWVQSKGEGILILGGSYIQASALHMNEGTISIGGTVTDVTLNPFAEYGLSDRVTLIASVPFRYVSLSDDIVQSQPAMIGGTLTGLGNAELYLRYRVKKQRTTAAAAEVGVSLPTASSKPEAGLRTGYPAVAVIGSFSAGCSNGKLFTWVEPGIVLRSTGYNAEWTAVAEIGFKTKLGLTPIINVNVRQVLAKGAATADNFGITGLYPNGTSWVAAAIKLGYSITDDFALWVAAGGGLGHLVAAAPSYNLAASLQLSKAELQN